MGRTGRAKRAEGLRTRASRCIVRWPHGELLLTSMSLGRWDPFGQLGICLFGEMYISLRKLIYMIPRTVRKRKLIDLEMPVLEALQVQALNNGVSVKSYMEQMIKEETMRRVPSIPPSVTSQKVLGLLGIARRVKIDPEDERAQYILSK